jgi:hypothetical protein
MTCNKQSVSLTHIKATPSGLLGFPSMQSNWAELEERFRKLEHACLMLHTRTVLSLPQLTILEQSELKEPPITDPV